MTDKPKLDIFRVLAAADKKQHTFYAELDHEEQKQLQPFLTLRWMSGTSNASQIMLLNEFVNPYAFSLTNHKQLLWQLLTVCSSGKSKRYVWNKLPSKRETGKTNAIKVLCEYFSYTASEAIDALPLLGRDDIVEMAEELGWQADDVAKVKRELKGETTASNKKNTKQLLDDIGEY